MQGCDGVLAGEARISGPGYQVPMSAVLLDEAVDRLTELFGELFGGARAAAVGLDGRAEDELERSVAGSAVEVAGMRRKQVVNADERNGDERDLGAQG
jgi:hypothetical protein